MYFQYFSVLVVLVSCQADDHLLTKEGSGFLDENIKVEIISKRTFDPLNNNANLKIVMDTIDDYSKSEGVRYPSENIKKSVQDHGGKFSVVFDIQDARCNEVRKFIRGAKKHSSEVSYSVMTCNGNTEVI